MNIRQLARVVLGLFVVAVCVSAQSAPHTERSSIGGTVVNSATGKLEAGVWVIADTNLAVPYRKIVVTGDQGRFFVPDQLGYVNHIQYRPNPLAN